MQLVFHFHVSADKYSLWSVWVYEWAVLLSSEKILDTKLDQIFWDVDIKKLGQQFEGENPDLNSTELKHRCTQIINMNKWAWLQRLQLFSSVFNVGWQNSSSIGQQHHLLKAQCYGIAFSLQQLSQTSIADLIKKQIEQGFAAGVGTVGSIFFFHLCPWSPHITSSVWECEGYTEARKQVKKWLRLTVNYLRRFTWMNMEVYTENIDTLIISYHTTRKPRIWQWHSNTSFIVIRSIKEHKQSLLLRCSRVNSFPHSK